MTYAPGAPAAIWALDLGTGCKLTLMALWSWADHEDQREYRDCTVWTKARDGLTHLQALRAAIAEQTGQSERAVRRHLGELRDLGLADVNGRCASLTAIGQACPSRVSSDRERADRERAPADRNRSAADRERARADRNRSLQLNPPVPPDPPTPGESARARDGEGDVVPLDGHRRRADRMRRAERNRAEMDRNRAAVAARAAQDHDAGRVDPAIAEAVAEVGSEWANRLVNDRRWCQSLGEAVRDLELSPVQVAAVLGAWSEANPRTRPGANAIWWGRNRDWVRQELGWSAEGKRAGSAAALPGAREYWEARKAEAGIDDDEEPVPEPTDELDAIWGRSR